MRKYIDIEIRDVFNVAVDLTISDIVNFVSECSDEEKIKIILALKQNGVSTKTRAQDTSLLDSMKIEFFHNNFDKISLDQLQSLIK